MRPVRILIFVLATFCVPLAVSAQSAEPELKPCSQDAVERQNLITEAEAAEFNVRRIEIAGATYSRYRVFSRKMAINEGDIFTIENLEKTIDGMNRLDVINSITIEDVEVRLDRQNRDIDFVFCVVQKEKK
jgi:outer membrane protein assembly factor BamA